MSERTSPWVSLRALIVPLLWQYWCLSFWAPTPAKSLGHYVVCCLTQSRSLAPVRRYPIGSVNVYERGNVRYARAHADSSIPPPSSLRRHSRAFTQGRRVTWKQSLAERRPERGGMQSAALAHISISEHTTMRESSRASRALRLGSRARQAGQAWSSSPYNATSQLPHPLGYTVGSVDVYERGNVRYARAHADSSIPPPSSTGANQRP